MGDTGSGQRIQHVPRGHGQAVTVGGHLDDYLCDLLGVVVE
ncbi:MAG: hypothetical protein ACRD1K_12930 [Acidimicrobiales bacterium]